MEVALLRQILWLLITALAVALLLRRVNLPYTVALVLVGLVLGVTGLLPRVQLTSDTILFIFLPALLFQAAIGLDLGLLRETALPILLLAVLGVGVSAGITAGLFSLATGISVGVSLVFAAMVSATDPVAVVAVFRKLGVPERLDMVVEGESLFNDGTSLVIFQIALVAVQTHTFSVLPALGQFAFTVLGGAALGAAAGFVISRVMALTTDHLVELGLSTVLAYGVYLLGETIHVSPVISVVVAGIVLRNYGAQGGMTDRAQDVINDIWEYLAFVINSLLFLLIGLQVKFLDYRTFIVPAAIAVGIVLFSRAVVIYGIGPLLTALGRTVPFAWRHLAFWGGLRGAMTLAMAISLPATFPDRELLVSITFSVVLFTILVQGLSIERVVRYLHLSEEKGATAEPQKADAG